jgi:hypothetical protein
LLAKVADQSPDILTANKRITLVELLFQPGIFGNVQSVSTEALFHKRIGVQVKAIALPETGLLLVDKFETAQPFGALPELPPRYHQPQRPAVPGGQGLAGVMGGQQAVRVQQVVE